jgi:hypothetical protein
MNRGGWNNRWLGSESSKVAKRKDQHGFIRISRQKQPAAVAQLVERVLGKDEVLGSNPSGSFR